MRAQKRTLPNNHGHSTLNRETLSDCNSVNNLRTAEKQRHSDQLRAPGPRTEYNNCIRRHVQSTYDSKENDTNARSKLKKKTCSRTESNYKTMNSPKSIQKTLAACNLGGLHLMVNGAVGLYARGTVPASTASASSVGTG